VTFEKEPEHGATGRAHQAAGRVAEGMTRAAGVTAGLKVAFPGFCIIFGRNGMNPTMKPAAPSIEYRFNTAPSDHVCPSCGSTFHAARGTWPFLAGTDAPVCGTADCPVGEDVTGPPPCDTLFAFPPMADATLAAIRGTDEGLQVGERLRVAALDETLPADDRALLERASIDLLFWEADKTRIHALEPRLVLKTCGQAAAEMLLSGCGDIL
jgi:hypothetical protein